ncbi:uncharacterized protein EV422DRAFT_511083 [Fimicolochytrium jonesii]|uniref:uncharacterized protein n=1 Tax=Fimicolochytrium jonesii TaxID=1396493 RepID=UPI0022FEA379|nr:uncharacterized protein EV422DRAFT_511083 [Fimicolochytrium jonesii]KAI8826688.1 hypothetical protein EV422DRAFT_511083 [Fimicolochytrium jonesii]
MDYGEAFLNNLPLASEVTEYPDIGLLGEDDIFKSFLNEDFAKLMDSGQFPLQDPLCSLVGMDMPLLDSSGPGGVPVPVPFGESFGQSSERTGSLSPHSVASNPHSFSYSSPSSAASGGLSPGMEWLLDFDDNLAALQNSLVSSGPPPAEPLLSTAPIAAPTTLVSCDADLPLPALETRLEPLLPIKVEPSASLPLPKKIEPIPLLPVPTLPAKAAKQPLAPKTSHPIHVNIQPKPTPDVAKPGPAALTAAERRAERLIKNRAAALESRKRKREQQQKLEKASEQLYEDNENLRARVADLEEKNRQLTEENGRLRHRLYNLDKRAADVSGIDPMNSFADLSTVLFEAPNKKAVGTALMAFFFSFALIFLPGFMSSSPHIGGHLAGRAYSDESSAYSGLKLLDPPPKILYLPASSPLPTESGLVPLSMTPASMQIRSSMGIPLHRAVFNDVLEKLVESCPKSEATREHRAHLATLSSLFHDQTQRDNVLVPAGARRKVSIDRSGKSFEQAASKYIKSDDSSKAGFVHIPPDCGVQYEADGTGAKAIPHLTLSDSIHLLPYRSLSDSGSRSARSDKDGWPADTLDAPRFSLVAKLPSSEVEGDSSRSNAGGFLHLDLEVIDARLVKWNESEP